MISVFSSIFPFFGHKECKNEISKLIQLGLDDNREMVSLNEQIISLLNQIQELKAISDYQTYTLEKTIIELKEKLKSSRKPKRKNYITTSKATDGNVVKIIDYNQKRPL